MIKRRFYKHEHGDRDDPSESSSSESEVEAEAIEETEEEEEEEEDAVAEVRENDRSRSSSSGYESEDSSVNEVNLDSSGLLTNDDDIGIVSDGQNVSESLSSGKSNAETVVDVQCNVENPSDISGCVLKCKTVFKCRLCPRIVCLTEETLKAHLKSKVSNLL
ncbi:unnamed protein product [Ilex paraguariensis]|uniref:Uncharacterized protein n=1 Tax=Ilex paraguariensis TaxID=185542 RepID=A0ABC8RFH8_9AQUA